MPELPEVEALADVLRERAVGRVVARVDVAAISVLKTFDPPLSSLGGLEVTGAERRGKFLCVDVSGIWMVIHLARAGWLRWKDEQPAVPPRPGKSPLALRLHLDDGSGFDLTEAGTKKGLAVYVVRDPEQVPGVARLGVEPLSDAFTVDALAGLLVGSRQQIKGVLRDQSVIAGIGNAYSDEVLHAAKLSPFRPAGNLTAEDILTLHHAILDTLRGAVGRSRGLATGQLKSEKKIGMRVHGRTGLPCPVCGDTVREVSFADRSLQYCATCQTGGQVLADRRLSRLLR